ncbi:PREDICTED: high-affinity lysophosphatidic acid receptor-like [Amphimedon queenslandica]|uniref:G-protein coupled receptors family 1 profile domain-containing protein n=1 Tax=Amphimedon queenslandica TaxID=400682 RepID=A0AAN0JIF2_AMPQE|nr:PREDICTED: high-affinity lysophosphatidic acid receptor-like [Amphimedon queenslandica]XP_019856582.1 PREDICTED: high-affinity lysophosphatidic acid receptor-like [Amphimedon queenslandica]|eukprot:XP_019856581.1 PREDICTED: high-affinity lysophosphatidic acid receptor-like [Amphimedon queenslandica]
MDDINNNFTLSQDVNGPLLAAVIGMEMLAGLITNSFVLILTACHLKNWKQPTTVFLSNMLANNLVVILFTMPLSIITTASGEWIFGSTVSQKESVCYFAAFIFIFSILTATESLVLLSFDRFFFIVKALHYKKYMTVNRAFIIVAVSWLLAAFLSMLPFFGFGAFEFASSYGMCVPGWTGQAGYAIFSFIVISIFIGSITVTSLWTMCFTRKYLKNAATNISTAASPGNPYAAQERRVIGLFGMLIIVHKLCYAPIVSFGLIEIFTDVLTPAAYAVAFVVLLLLTVLIPLVQSFFRRDIKDAIVKGHRTLSRSIKRGKTYHQSSSAQTVKPSNATTSSYTI